MLDGMRGFEVGFEELDEAAAIRDPGEFASDEPVFEFEHGPSACHSGGGFLLLL